MKVETEYVYSFANASLTLRVMEYFRTSSKLPIDSVAVVNLIDRWVIKVRIKDSISTELAKDMQAFLNEMGIIYQPSSRVELALKQLDAGVSPTEVMNKYQVVIVAHGQPDLEEIKIFRRQIVSRLGYCPQNMA